MSQPESRGRRGREGERPARDEHDSGSDGSRMSSTAVVDGVRQASLVCEAGGVKPRGMPRARVVRSAPRDRRAARVECGSGVPAPRRPAEMKKPRAVDARVVADAAVQAVTKQELAPGGRNDPRVSRLSSPDQMVPNGMTPNPNDGGNQKNE